MDLLIQILHLPTTPDTLELKNIYSFRHNKRLRVIEMFIALLKNGLGAIVDPFHHRRALDVHIDNIVWTRQVAAELC